MFLTILVSSLIYIVGVSAVCHQGATDIEIRQTAFEENVYSTGCAVYFAGQFDSKQNFFLIMFSSNNFDCTKGQNIEVRDPNANLLFDMCIAKNVSNSSIINIGYIGSYVSIWFLNDAAGTGMSSYVHFNKFDNINSSPPTPIKTPPTTTTTTTATSKTTTTTATSKTTTTTASTGTTTSTASNTIACQKAFCDAMLQRHNELRAKHSAPALSQDATLSQNAQAYASKLARDNSGLVHSGGGSRYGENLALYSGFHFDWVDLAGCSNMGTQMTDLWYNEVSSYDYNNPVFSLTTGHFTQVVWVATNKIGCGIDVSSSGKIYGVGQYTPPGNYAGEFQTNVLRATS